MRPLAVLGLVIGATFAACGGDDGGASPTGSDTTGPTGTSAPSQTPVTRPVGEDAAIWADVLRATAGNVSPVLRPTALPQGLDTVWLDVLDAPSDAHSFVVGYSGRGKLLHVGVGLFNPPPAGPGGSQALVQMRGLQCAWEKGKECVLQVGDSANRKSGVSLWWSEPGTWIAEPGGTPQDSLFYLIWSEGISEQEVMDFAESLRPAAAGAAATTPASAGAVDTFVLLSFRRVDPDADPKGDGPVYIVNRELSIRTHSSSVKRIEVVAGIGSQDVAASATVFPDAAGYATATLTLPKAGIPYVVQGYGISVDQSAGDMVYGDERAVPAAPLRVMAEGPYY
ncbi:MAG TPA: hypothetical protein VLS25_13440 [Dehalococcoidia bacterium]|nr:hypothetical protein [Dehalococcoidia bacterium]